MTQGGNDALCYSWNRHLLSAQADYVRLLSAAEQVFGSCQKGGSEEQPAGDERVFGHSASVIQSC